MAPDPKAPWTAERFEAAFAPYLAAHDHVRFDPPARQAHLTSFSDVEPRVWHVQQALLDPDEVDTWCVEAEVDLRTGEPEPGEPILRLLGIHD